MPVLINRRQAEPSGLASGPAGALSRRDLINRQAFPLGRHILGYEVQKVLAGVDVLLAGNAGDAAGIPKVGVAGYGEGGLIAFYSAALDPRINAALVSGYFDSRQKMGDEPFSRSLFGFHREFGDAEIATLIAPRGLIIEFSLPPDYSGVSVAATNDALATTPPHPPDYASVEAEFDRARMLMKTGRTNGLSRFTLISGTEGMATGPGSDRALTALLKDLGCALEQVKPSGAVPDPPTDAASPAARQQRQFEQLERFTRQLGDKIEGGR